ncbi:Cytochrome c oxidase, subunit VIb [Parasponia andersonii]|uniref:Cytochrome c oxidase, subunit VIb n=1 Tax=Parasponia andersonii TaxID=3476 RepID=A0A2P5A746_PARAD|nr:Cytochrome c oxidase, subunit VIb [Parasponia andersonii]
MAEAKPDQTITLSQQYALKESEDKMDVNTKPVEVKEVANPVNTAPEEFVAEKTEEPLAAAAKETTEITPLPVATEESSETAPSAVVHGESTEDSTAAAESGNETAAEESSESTENSSEQEAVEEEAAEIKLETAPADFRFPTTNQTRHCFTRYIEYHRCVAAKGEGAPECDRFQKYYRSLCPGEWVERWNEQRENGTFPGPL